MNTPLIFIYKTKNGYEKTGNGYHHFSNYQTIHGTKRNNSYLKGGEFFRILFISMFLSPVVSYVVRGRKKRSVVRSFIHVDEIPSISAIYQFLSSFDKYQCIHHLSDILNTWCKRSNHRKNRTTIS